MGGEGEIARENDEITKESGKGTLKLCPSSVGGFENADVANWRLTPRAREIHSQKERDIN